MENVQRVFPRAFLLASVVSAFAAQAICASQIANESATADNERERE